MAEMQLVKLAEEAECLRKISRQGKSAVWEKFSQIVTKSTEGNPMLKPLEPDLIGEYFVLNFLRDQVADERYQGRIRLFWEEPGAYAYFLIRCMDSYLSQQEFQVLLNENKTLFWFHNGNELATYLSALLLVKLTAKQDAVARVESVERLKKLSQEKYAGNEKIALAYAKSLAYLVLDQDAISGAESVDCLKKLSEEEYDGNEEIALYYAHGLTCLTLVQDAISRAESIKRLRILSQEKYAGNKKIALVYAQGLTYLIIEQDTIAGSESVVQLRTLSEAYADNDKIALEYTKGLSLLCFNELSAKIVIQECQKFYADWQADPEAVKQAVSAKPESNMKTLKLFLLEHTELFPGFMEWLVA